MHRTVLLLLATDDGTTEGPLSLAVAALNFGVIVGVAGELSCEGKRSERAAARGRRQRRRGERRSVRPSTAAPLPPPNGRQQQSVRQSDFECWRRRKSGDGGREE